METQINKIEYKYDAKELHLEMKSFIADVRLLIADKNYHLSDESLLSLNKYDTIPWDEHFQSMSMNMRKKFNKYLRGYRQKKNSYRVNRLFHFIHTRILASRNVDDSFSSLGYGDTVTFKSPDWITKVSLQKPLKEQAIQSKRKEWVEARDKAIDALNAYKLEKGDYYKS
jgi:hypothetical protein